MVQDENKTQRSKRQRRGGADKDYSKENRGQPGGIQTAKSGHKAGDVSKTRYEHRVEPSDKSTHRKKKSPKASTASKPTGKFYSGRSASAEEVRVGDRAIVTIKRIGINGEGVAYYKRKAAFLDNALPGEVVKATISEVQPGFLRAEINEWEKKSPDRQEPPCPVYERCGGCQLQHMTYAAQLQAKEELLREAFRRYAKIEDLPLRPIAGMKEPWGYRNKAQLPVGWEGGRMIAGLYEADSHKLVNISGCPIQHPVVNEVMDQAVRLLTELGIPPYEERKRKGVIKTIVARVGQASQQVQLTFITAGQELPHREQLVERIRETLPAVVSIAQNVNDSATPAVFGSDTRILWGEEQLEETLGDVHFSLSPRAFFQLNPSQTVKLYDYVKEAASLKGTELVVDAYCGTGTIGLWLAPDAREVRGIEVVAEAVQDARDNARSSGVENAEFYEGRAEKLLPEWVKRGIRPDVLVVDPPRTGCERPLLEAIAQARPARLVYVSCNPSTLAKDCQVLLEGDFRIEWVQPVDMFPQTAHVECVVGICCVNT